MDINQTTRSRWKFRMCTPANECTLCSSPPLYILWTEDGPQWSKHVVVIIIITRYKTVVFWRTHPLSNRSEVPGGFEMWCWRRMEKIIRTDRVRKMKCFTMSMRKCLSQIHWKEGRSNGLVTYCLRNCLLKHVIDWKIEGRIRSGGETRKKT